MTLASTVSEVLIIWERPAVSEFAPRFRSDNLNPTNEILLCSFDEAPTQRHRHSY